jgi:pteridine reductase
MRKVALVTGAGKRRVGWHVVQALAERGYSLVVHYHRAADDAAKTVGELTTRGLEAVAVGADLADEGAVQQMVASCLKQFGRLDVLVNTAAIWEAKPLEDITADDVRRHFETNALGTFLCCQLAGLAMTTQTEGGSIINLGDWAEARPYLNYAAYFCSKGAISTLTRTFAIELAARNPRVRVNCVLPGPVMLPPDLPMAEREASIAGTLAKREGSPTNVALAVLHFIDNDFVTGACLPVDGGRTIYTAGEER